jgi:hypothetical protein
MKIWAPRSRIFEPGMVAKPSAGNNPMRSEGTRTFRIGAAKRRCGREELRLRDQSPMHSSSIFDGRVRGFLGYRLLRR